MFYVGLDVHTKQVTICVLDGDGKLVLRGQVRQLDELKRFSERLGSPSTSSHRTSSTESTESVVERRHEMAQRADDRVSPTGSET